MDYSAKTTAELKKLMTEKNIKNRSKITKKDDMIAALSSSDNEGQQPQERLTFEPEIGMKFYNKETLMTIFYIERDGSKFQASDKKRIYEFSKIGDRWYLL
jgi:hypothetical protein